MLKILEESDNNRDNIPAEIQPSNSMQYPRIIPINEVNPLALRTEQSITSFAFSRSENEEFHKKSRKESRGIIDSISYSTMFGTPPANSKEVTQLPIGLHKSLTSSIEFPHTKALNDELKKSFTMIEENMPPFSEEINELSLSLLPVPPENMKTVVIGLENTLVHIENNGTKVRMRAHALKFLKEVSEVFELIVYSTEPEEVVARVLSQIDPEKKYVKHALNRQHCIQRDNGSFIKDLRIINNRDKEKMVVIDSNVFSNMEHLKNMIYISSFNNCGKKGDTELLEVLKFLLVLNTAATDICTLIKIFSGIIWLRKRFHEEYEYDVSYKTRSQPCIPDEY